MQRHVKAEPVDPDDPEHNQLQQAQQFFQPNAALPVPFHNFPFFHHPLHIFVKQENFDVLNPGAPFLMNIKQEPNTLVFHSPLVKALLMVSGVPFIEQRDHNQTEEYHVDPQIISNYLPNVPEFSKIIESSDTWYFHKWVKDALFFFQQLKNGIKTVANIDRTEAMFERELVQNFPESEDDYKKMARSILLRKVEEMKMVKCPPGTTVGEYETQNNKILSSIFYSDMPGPPKDMLNICKGLDGAHDFFSTLGDRHPFLYSSYQDPFFFNEADVFAFRKLVLHYTGHVNPLPQLGMMSAAKNLFEGMNRHPIYKLFDIAYPKFEYVEDYEGPIPKTEDREIIILLHNKLELDRVMRYDILPKLPSPPIGELKRARWCRSYYESIPQ